MRLEKITCYIYITSKFSGSRICLLASAVGLGVSFFEFAMGFVLQPELPLVVPLPTSLHSPQPAMWCCVGCVLQPCSVVTAVGSNNNGWRTQPTQHGNQRLHVQWWKAPDDGHSSVRNM
jgi:hypothetical protein